MTFVYQQPANPNAILDAIEQCAAPDVTTVRIAVAYATQAGVRLLIPRLRLRMAASWDTAEKTVVSGLDYGLTDPDALEDLAAAGFSAYIRDPGVITRSLFRPRSAYHPKLYAFGTPTELRRATGSPNLTDRALTINTELVEVLATPGRDPDVDDFWSSLLRQSAAPTRAILSDYRIARAAIAAAPSTWSPPPDVADAPLLPSSFDVVPASVASGTFEDAVSGGLRPEALDNFWIEAGSMSSGGSHNQLELPRLGQRFFFGPGFADYDRGHHLIGTPRLMSLGQSWLDKPVTWHGNNRMERINLPTIGQGGFEYTQQAILFRRNRLGFELLVEPWDSPVALGWRQASTLRGLVFRLGVGTARVCGLF